MASIPSVQSKITNFLGLVYPSMRPSDVDDLDSNLLLDVFGKITVKP